MQHCDNLLVHEQACVCLCVRVFLFLPVGKSAAGSWWGVRGVAGFERRDHPDTEGEYDYLHQGQNPNEL